MAITASSFRRGTSGGAASFKGMRRFSPKDTTTLLKTVDAINKNLVSINKLLQQQNALTIKKQQTEQREKRIQRESAVKASAENAIETTKTVGKNIIRGLKNTAKKITGGLFSFLKPFIKFFTITFIGWFSKGVMKWFDQDGEKKKKQLKEWVPKILKTLAIIGGVIAALQFGLPLLLTALGTLIGTIPIVLGALLNPITWKALLAVGAGVGLMELFERGMDGLDPGQRARERVRRILNEQAATGRKFGLELVQGNPRTATKGEKYYDQFYKIGDKLYSATDISTLLSSATKFDEEFKTYRKDKDGKIVETGEMEQVNREAIKEQKALAGLTEKQRKDITDQLTGNRISAAYKEYYRAKNAFEGKQKDIERVRAQATFTSRREGGKRFNTRESYIKYLESQASAEQNNMKHARNIVSTMFNQLNPEQQEMLKTKLGITSDQLFPESLTEAQTAFVIRKGLNFVGDMVETPLQNVVSMMDNFKAGVTEQFNNLANTVSDIEFNFNINPVATESDDDIAAVPVDGIGISPFDTENAFLQYAKSTYILLGVL